MTRRVSNEKVMILKEENHQEKLSDFNAKKNFYQRKGLILQPISNVSIHQNSSVPYINFKDKCCDRTFSPRKLPRRQVDAKVHLQHGVVEVRKAAICERTNNNNPLKNKPSKSLQDDTSKSRSKLFHKISKWKKNLSKLKSSSKKPPSDFSSSQKPLDRHHFVSPLMTSQMQSKALAEEAKKYYLKHRKPLTGDGLPFSLINVLRCEGSRKLFREFLTKEHSEENIDFWLDIKKYKSNPDLDEAIRIFLVYVDKEAPKEINLSHRTKGRIIENLKKEKNRDRLYDEAQLEIFKLMQKDSFVRFKVAAI